MGKHPVVQKLWLSVTKSITPGASFNARFPGFKSVVRSLATPCAVLWDKNRKSRTHPGQIPAARGRAQKRSWNPDNQWEEFKASFCETIELLCTMDWLKDEHWDMMKFHLAVLVQRAVGDDRCGSGHEILAVPSSLVTTKPLFSGLINWWLKREVARARGSKSTSQRSQMRSLSLMQSFLLSKRGWAKASTYTLQTAVYKHQIRLTSVGVPLNEETKTHIRLAVDKIVKPVDVYSNVSLSRHASNTTSRKAGGVLREVAGEGFPVSQLAAPSLRTLAHSVGEWKKGVFGRCEQHVIAQELSGTSRFVKAQFLYEPGKIRAISVGDAFLNTFLTPLQSHLIQCWKSSDYSTMRPDWERRVEKFIAPLSWVWNSIDYEAATDLLKLESTGVAIAEVSTILGLDLPTDLGGTTIEYSEKLLDRSRFPELKATVVQTNGQLMGHPLSFPLLCMINLSALLRAITICKASGLITKAEGEQILSMTVLNGDDLLFPCPPSFVAVFEQCALDVGLKPSLGKSYTSRYFAMVNNVQFLMTPKGGRQFGYVNQKLIYNFSLKSGEEKDSPFEIGHAFNKMFELCPDALAFLPDGLMNRASVPIAGYQPNFFFPSHLGGFGVDPKFATAKIGATRLQRQIAAAATEGVLNSFLLRTKGVVQSVVDKELAKLVAKLPKPVARSYGGSAIYESTRERWLSDAPQEGSYSSDSTAYSSWIGLMESIKPAAAAPDKTVPEEQESVTADREVRRLKDTISDVKPMTLAKCLSADREWLYPQLPKSESGLVISYDRRLRTRAQRFGKVHFTMPNGETVFGHPLTRAPRGARKSGGYSPWVPREETAVVVGSMPTVGEEWVFTQTPPALGALVVARPQMAGGGGL